MKIFIATFSFLFALALVWFAAVGMVRPFLRWRRAPETLHETVLFLGAQFTGWQMLVPAVACLFAAAAIAAGGIWILRSNMAHH